MPNPWNRRVAVIVICGLLGACQSRSNSPRTPQVIVQNPQGTTLPGALTPTATAVLMPNLIVNGDFSANWSEGWTREAGSPINGVSVTEVIDRSSATSGKAIHLTHDGESLLMLSQDIVLPSLDINFQGQIFPQADTPCRGILAHCSGVAGLFFEFYGHRDGKDHLVAVLGYVYAGTDPDLFPISNAERRIVPIKTGWQTISLNFSQEIENTLPEVTPGEIRRVRIYLLTGAIGACKAGQCLADLHASDLTLRAEQP